MRAALDEMSDYVKVRQRGEREAETETEIETETETESEGGNNNVSVPPAPWRIFGLRMGAHVCARKKAKLGWSQTLLVSIFRSYHCVHLRSISRSHIIGRFLTAVRSTSVELKSPSVSYCDSVTISASKLIS